MPGAFFTLRKELKKTVNIVLLFVLFMVVSFCSGYYNFSLYHIGVELYSTILTFIIIAICLQSKSLININYFVFYSLASVFIGVSSLLHIFLHEKIMLFPYASEDIKAHIWLVLRFSETYTLIFSLVVSRIKKMERKVFITYVLMLTVLLTTVLLNLLMPHNIFSDQTRTEYEIFFKYIIILAQLIAKLFIVLYRKFVPRKIFQTLLVVVVLLTVYDISLPLHQVNFPFFCILGHSFKAIAYSIIYRTVSIPSQHQKLIKALTIKSKELKDKSKQHGDAIKESKYAENLLRENEERYRSIIMNMNECFVLFKIILDDDGRPVDCIALEGNNAFFEVTGLKRENVIGKRASESSPFLKNTIPNFFDTCGKVALTGEKINLEMFFVDFGVWINLSTFSPEKGYFINIFSDITKRKLAEEEIRKLSRAVEQSQSVIIITNTMGEIEYVNPKFTEVTGYTREEATGKNTNILRPEIHLERVYKQLWDTVKKGEKWRGELMLKKKNGDLYWANISVSPIRNNENIVTHYVAIHEDITTQKLLYQKLEENNKNLELTLEKLKLTQMQLVQKEKLAGIGQLAAGVAHEINNPLGFIMSNFETLQKYTGKLKEIIDVYRSVKSISFEEDENGINQIMQSITEIETANKADFILEDLNEIYKDTYEGLERISNIVTNLKNFSRVDQQNEFLEYDLNAGIKNALIVANNEIKYYAEVEERLGKIPMIFANGGQINQVLLNIIMNGVQAIKAKHSDKMGKIRITTSHDDRYVYCSIEDDGIGIAEENLNKIYDPFFTTKKVGEGIGLGLSISYDIIVYKHRGRLTVESTPGEGTIFTIKLPIRGSSDELIA